MPEQGGQRREGRFKPRRPVYGAINPGLTAVGLENLSRSGMSLLYFSDSGGPQPIREVFLLLDGFVHRLPGGAFCVVHDSAVRGLARNGRQLRRAGIRFRGRPFEWLFARVRKNRDRVAAVVV